MQTLISLGIVGAAAFVAHTSWIRMFQIKEYRFDRLKSQLIEGGWDFIRANTGKLPAKTARNLLLVVGSMIVHLIILSWVLPGYITDLFQTGIAVFISFPIGLTAVATSVALTAPLASRKRHKLIERATHVLSQRDVSATVISGSYGKSSVKEYLYAISSAQFHTAKTRNNMNTDVGVSVCVLDSVTPETQQFIAEVGGYKRGEVRDAAKVLSGHIDTAIITAFGNQHVSLYGSRDNLIRAESEIIPMLNTDSPCYINLSAFQEPVFQTEILPTAQCRFITYSTDPQSKADITASQIQTTRDGTQAHAHYKGKRIPIQTQLLGAHAIENLLPVVGWGIDHAMNEKVLTQTIATIKPIPHKLSVHRGVGESVVLDDSGNSSLHGFLAAIDVMQLFPQKNKIIIGPGIIELGSEKGSVYERLIQRLNDVSAAYITTDSSFNKYRTNSNIQIVKTEREIMRILQDFDKKNACILLEGRQPKKRLESIIIEV